MADASMKQIFAYSAGVSFLGSILVQYLRNRAIDPLFTIIFTVLVGMLMAAYFSQKQ
ncbi:Uncharacterised protein [uncultured archaeon]|nr:Uncharacterised protein [uncultured archaeon]